MTNKLEPMLAHPMPEDFSPLPGEWVAEEKYDGHRIMIQVHVGGGVTAWSRLGLFRVLPPQVDEGVSQLPAGLYDGELCAPGKRSYGVTEKANAADLVYVIFDLVELLGVVITSRPFSERRSYLHEMFSNRQYPGVELAWQQDIGLNGRQVIEWLAKQVWNRDGEGLILKRLSAPYRPGKRSKDQLKVKQARSAVLTITGFAPGKLGLYSVVLLRDDEGNETRVKTRDDAERARFATSFRSYVGRRLRIDYQERTPDGKYRHPMYDRLEEE